MRFSVLIVSFLLPFAARTQNLILNGSFEDENICTEYHEPCAPEGWLGNTGGFKNYFVDSGAAYEGSHYLAIEAGRTRNKYQRSYTRTQLICSLRPGNKYRLQLYLKSPTDILDSIGIYFTPADFLFDKNLLYQVTPTAYVIDENKPERNNHGWQKISFTYTATGNEKFLTIANFSKRDINTETGLPGESHFFVYVDAVSLVPLNPDEKLCADWEVARTLIYEMNDRHEYFERYVRFYRSQNKVAPPPKLSLTRIFRSAKIVLNDGLFIPGRSNLQDNGYTILDNFLNNLSGRADFAEISVYADSTGNAYGTDEISLQRSSLVKEYTRRKLKIEEKNIKVNGMQSGEAPPISSSAKTKKRRVELMIYFHE